MDFFKEVKTCIQPTPTHPPSTLAVITHCPFNACIQFPHTHFSTLGSVWIEVDKLRWSQPLVTPYIWLPSTTQSHSCMYLVTSLFHHQCLHLGEIEQIRKKTKKPSMLFYKGINELLSSRCLEVKSLIPLNQHSPSKFVGIFGEGSSTICYCISFTLWQIPTTILVCNYCTSHGKNPTKPNVNCG